MYFEIDMSIQTIGIICVTVLMVNLVRCLLKNNGGDNNKKGE